MSCGRSGTGMESKSLFRNVQRLYTMESCCDSAEDNRKRMSPANGSVALL
jgi:hypothetical protein